MSEVHQVLGFSMREDVGQVLRTMAKQIHRINVEHGFQQPCPNCGTGGWFDVEMDRCPPGPKAVHQCEACNGRGSSIDDGQFYRMLNHIHGEVTELFDLTRDHSLPEVRRFTGRPGVVPREGYQVFNPCVPAVPDKHLPGHPAGAVEIADAIIRLLDLAECMGYDIGSAVEDKVAFNNGRPFRHGRNH